MGTTLWMLAIALQFRRLTSTQTIVAAVLSERAMRWDYALTQRVSALGWFGHGGGFMTVRKSRSYRL